MTTSIGNRSESAPSPGGQCGAHENPRSLYFKLMSEPDRHRTHACRFLSFQLQRAAALDCDLPRSLGPDGIRGLQQWLDRDTAQTCRQYRRYLAGRRTGAPRQYFVSKAHALYFLRTVAPTKMVDGSWLYGLLSRWDDSRFTQLIQIYLEELGEGIAAQNHVVIYRNLLAAHGCSRWDDLADKFYLQGAIQLALAHSAEEFLPELIGFNLGYEQLPLHLLITTYELEELGIDPYYFSLHVTVDNAASGHARKSLEALADALPQFGNVAEFYRRVCNGYRLNRVGAGTIDCIESFNLDCEVKAIFREKSRIGKLLHSDSCRIGGRTINAWLSDPDRVPSLIAKLEQEGWIKRDQDPEHSPFWRLLQGSRAKMFGVFSAYEQQLIYDWIAGTTAAAPGAVDSRSRGAALPQRHTGFGNRQRGVELERPVGRLVPTPEACSAGLRGSSHDLPDWAGTPHQPSDTDFDRDLRLLEQELATLSRKQDLMNRLVELMAPSRHHSAAGLMATRIFTRMMT